MRKAGQRFILITLLLISAVLIAAVLFTVPNQRLDSTVFWIAFSCAFPLNLVMLFAVHIWCGKKNGNALVQMPVAYRVALTFYAIYLVAGAIFMYAAIENLVAVLVAEVLITVVYIIIAMYCLLAVNHIVNNENNIKSKVAYIAILKEDIEVIIPRVADTAAKNALMDLAECVRFSDPMSHPSLAGVEMQLTVEVSRISSLVNEGRIDEVVSAVGGAKALLESRNRRCMMLK